ncbi:DUF2652 domain-containing protein [Flavobacterium chilense]|uniref:DUF2652 domain-containing protein n=1 Tax=Flavobacterium chilense TaxID=946677 RepID=A0A1M7MDV5_9FLAO|nr:DUF2652 domain-containing protein [Flavobacterium chilense]SHM88926.1 Protein of unknown function [Flavobacterium chilense]
MPAICSNQNGEATFPTLILIPDISGFTKYMYEADLNHSQVKIGQLLESIIENNILKLKISEIEGDAVLFYDFNNTATLDEIMNQCHLMFTKFHEKLKEISESGCLCGSCVSLQSLSLKFVVHHGILGSIMIKEFCKLYGKELIVAHRLLKNDIPIKEYFLLTEQFIHHIEEHNNMKNYSIPLDSLSRGSIKDDGLGVIEFRYGKMRSS